jgi:hypothetical protein
MNVVLPQITVQEYKDFIDEHINAYINDPTKRIESLPPALLNERKRYAQGLRAIILVPQISSYILLYDSRYIVKLISPDFLTIATLNRDNPLVLKQGTIHYLVMKVHWFNEAPHVSQYEQGYQIIEQSLPNVELNPHVTYFCVRYKIMMFSKFDIASIIPPGLQLSYANQGPRYIMCYGTGKESPDINYQMDVYLRTLVQLITPGVTNADKVTILCNQLTNEISGQNPENGQTQIQLDIHLVEEVRIIFEADFQTANDRANLHLTKLLSMPNKAAGLELSGYTANMLCQIFPQFQLTALTPDFIQKNEPM